MAAALNNFLESTDWKTLNRLNGWGIEQDQENSHIVRFTLSAKDGELFTVRLVCDDYPRAAPSVKFIDFKGDVSNKAAWPKGNSAFHEVVKLPPESFLCTDLTREGIEHHQDWKNSATGWKPDRTTLMDVFNYLQRLLKSDNYQGRNGT